MYLRLVAENTHRGQSVAYVLLDGRVQGLRVQPASMGTSARRAGLEFV
jgi:hypothetical protein